MAAALQFFQFFGQGGDLLRQMAVLSELQRGKFLFVRLCLLALQLDLRQLSVCIVHIFQEWAHIGRLPFVSICPRFIGKDPVL